jgi:oligosaccharide 4-alpha-D-glucosyltransferase
MEERNSYLWGDAFLVAPVTARGAREWPVRLPGGVWFDYWNGERHEGDRTLTLPVDMRTIPVLVRAGSFVPMVPVQRSADNYSSEQLELHYYADASVRAASGEMYEDDGLIGTNLENGHYELLQFAAWQQKNRLDFTLTRNGQYPGRPDSRELTLVVHNVPAGMRQVSVDGAGIALVGGEAFTEQKSAAWHDQQSGRLHIRFTWQAEQVKVSVH